MAEHKHWTYAEAGVDIEAGERAVDLIKEHVRRTHRPEVLGDLGGFGGLFALDRDRYREPVLVASTDGVGTKLKIAFEMDRHDTIGIDAVAMCLNDILVQGAEPLFFLDYLATGKLKPSQVKDIVKGLADGCCQANCALIGGETAEMPGFYKTGEYDVAGFAVGVVERDRLLDGTKVAPGDVLLGLASSGLHSNGFSLVRKLLLEECGYSLYQTIPGLQTILGEELLKPTRIYVLPVLEILEEHDVHGMSHITGGGLPGNTARMIPPSTDAIIYNQSWKVPQIFNIVKEEGLISEAEMYRTFNMGIGFVLAVPPCEVRSVRKKLAAKGETVVEIGEVAPGEGRVKIV